MAASGDEEVLDGLRFFLVSPRPCRGSPFSAMERALNQEYKDVSLNSGFYTTGNLLKLASLMFKTSSLIIPILGFDKFADCFEIHSGVINWLTSKFCPFLRIISQSLLQVKMAIGHKSGQLAVNRNLLGFGVGKFPFLIRLPSC